MPATSPRAANLAALLTGLTVIEASALLTAGIACANRPATIAEADGAGNVTVHIVFYSDLSCTGIAELREGAPPNIEAPQRTLTVTALLDRRDGPCDSRPEKIEKSITIKDRQDALSVDIFYVDEKGTFVRSQRPRIYRD